VLGAIGVSLLLADDGSPVLYAEEVREQAFRIDQLVPSFQALILELGSTDRILLDETIDEVVATIEDARSVSAEMTAPDAASDVPVVFELATDAWIRGLERFRAALLKAADDPVPLGVESEVIDAFVELRVGDELYAQMVQRLAAADIAPAVGPIPSIIFFPRTFPIAGTASTVVAFAAADGSPLELNAVLGIEQVTTDPAWIVDVTDALVIENTASVVVKVVVANTGNTDSNATTIGVELVSTEGILQTRVLDVPVLSPQSTTTLSTDALEVTPGALYELLVGLPIANIDQTDQSLGRRFEFRINEQVSTTTTLESTTTSGG
jgi:hypothetical protein